MCFQAGPWALLKRHYYGELDDSPGGGSPRVAPSPFLGAASASWAVDGGGAPGWRFFRVVQTAPNGRETEMQQMQAQTQRRRMEDMRRRADQQQAAQQAAQQDVQDWAAQQQQQQGLQGPAVQQGPVQQQPPGDQQQGPVQQQPPDGQQPLPHQDQQDQQDQQQQGQQQLPAAVPPQPADQRPPPQPVQPLQPPPAQPAPLTPPRQQGNGSNVLRCAGIEFWGVLTYDHAAAKPPLVEEAAAVEDEEEEEGQGAELPGAGGGEPQVLGEAVPPAAAQPYDSCVLEYYGTVLWSTTVRYNRSGVEPQLAERIYGIALEPEPEPELGFATLVSVRSKPLPNPWGSPH